jgi:hypothetical protein
MQKTSMMVSALVALTVVGISARQASRGMNMKVPTVASPEVQARVRQAMQAAPPDISGNATIMDWPENEGAPMKHLRAGTNGWTCMPSSPAPPAGAAREDPMCADAPFSALLEAWTTRSDPHLTTVGIAYMLRGDKGASNTDPFAIAPAVDNHWIVSPPHLMIAVPNPQQLDAFPTDPQAGGPWVMWKGTPYAHLMVPTAAKATPTTTTTRMSDR